MAEAKLSKFNKSQLLKSKKYVNKTDVLNVILEEGKEYTIKEVDALIDGFMKKEVE